MLRGEYQEQKERYGGVQEYFEKKKLHDTAGLAQSFYILYMGQVLSRPDTYQWLSIAYSISCGFTRTCTRQSNLLNRTAANGRLVDRL